MARSPRDVAISSFRAEESRDIDLILSHYADDAVFIPADHHVQGIEAIRPFYEDSAVRFPGLDVELPNIIESGDEVVAEWSAWPQGERFNLVGASVLLIHDGRTVELRAYYDQSTGYAE